VVRMKRFPMERSSGGRGRHKQGSFTELANRWYLIWISKKYELETGKFLACFLDAWRGGRSSCKDVSIQCRQKMEDHGIFLVTRDQEVIAQLSMSEAALKRLPDVDLTTYPWKITF
jgi:hypothetical protein